jgi:chromosome segregation ATPase
LKSEGLLRLADDKSNPKQPHSTSDYDAKFVTLFDKAASAEEKLKLVSQYEEKQKALSDDIKQQRESVGDLDFKFTARCARLTRSIDDLSNGVNGLRSDIDNVVTTVDVHDGIVDDLKTTTNTLDTTTKALVTKTDALDAKTSDLDTKINDLDTKTNDLNAKTNTLSTKTDTLNKNQKMQAGRLDKLDQRMTDLGKLEKSVTDVRKDLRKTEDSLSSFQKSLNMKQIEVFCGKFSAITLALIQIQKVLNDLNANIKGGGLEFEFEFDVADMKEKLSEESTVANGKKKRT